MTGMQACYFGHLPKHVDDPVLSQAMGAVHRLQIDSYGHKTSSVVLKVSEHVRRSSHLR
jgi:hypothetical protein